MIFEQFRTDRDRFMPEKRLIKFGLVVTVALWLTMLAAAGLISSWRSGCAKRPGGGVMIVVVCVFSLRVYVF